MTIGRVFERWKPTARRRSHRIEFNGQAAQEFLAGETLHGLAKRHDISRNLIRLRVQRYQAGVFDEDAAAADLIEQYEAGIAALERLVGKQALAGRRKSPWSGESRCDSVVWRFGGCGRTRGGDERSGSLFSYVDLEARVGKDHPLRTIRGVVNEALAAPSGEFSAPYSPTGRPSIPPEKLLRAVLLQAFYSIRSERRLVERLQFDLLLRWFAGVGVDDAARDHSTSSKNRERLLEGDIAATLLGAVLAQPRVKRLLSTDHFSVDGALIEAWASMKNFKPRDGSGEPPTPSGGRNREADFHGLKRSNETHASTTDPEARLYRNEPGKEAKLCFIGHALMENRAGPAVDARLTQADGHAERIAALRTIEPRADRPRPIASGADKGYDAEDFVNELRPMNATPRQQGRR